MGEKSSESTDETESERNDRNWNELLQELRVSQTGVQLLTGLLLTLPFQDKFATLTNLQRDAYLVIVCAAVLATALLISPVALHRMLFRQGEKSWLIRAGNMAAHGGLACLSVAMVGVIWLIFSVVASQTAGWIVGAVATAVFVALWWVLPVTQLAKSD